MKETGILFRPEMIRAYFEGRKTQTRRVIKGEPTEVVTIVGRDNKPNGEYVLCFDGFNSVIQKRIRCPYGNKGDVIWSRETIGYPRDGGPVIYRADGGWAESPDFAKNLLEDGKWTPAIHQPRCHSRASMVLSNVRAERLQDITEADAIAEGFYFIYEFARYIDEINGKGTWECNPWVWVLEFPRFAKGL